MCQIDARGEVKCHNIEHKATEQAAVVDELGVRQVGVTQHSTLT